jgi:hypothetical protein
VELMLLPGGEVPDAMNAKVRIAHFAPFAADLDATRVDICTAANTAILQDREYRYVSDYLPIPPGAYELHVAVAGTGCADVALQLPAVQLAAGTVVDIYAIGAGTEEFPLAYFARGPLVTLRMLFLPLIRHTEPLGNVAQLVLLNPNLTTVAYALSQAGLIDVLAQQGPFTLFIPVNQAFAAIPEATLNQLLADPTGNLSTLLLYHVVPGLYTSADLSAGLTLATAQGATISFSGSGTGLQVNSANIVTVDIPARNGVIHLIDAVLLDVLE